MDTTVPLTYKYGSYLIFLFYSYAVGGDSWIETIALIVEWKLETLSYLNFWWFYDFEKSQKLLFVLWKIKKTEPLQKTPFRRSHPCANNDQYSVLPFMMLSKNSANFVSL